MVFLLEHQRSRNKKECAEIVAQAQNYNVIHELGPNSQFKLSSELILNSYVHIPNYDDLCPENNDTWGVPYQTCGLASGPKLWQSLVRGLTSKNDFLGVLGSTVGTVQYRS